MAEITTAEVCKFLENRLVSEEVIKKFTDNKVDGNVVKLMTKEELNQMGLSAVGDVIALKYRCNATKAESDKRSERRNDLLKLLREDNTSSKSTQKKHRGRPKKLTKIVSFGLRLSDKQIEERKASNIDEIITNVKSPLGDKNYIQIELPTDKPYDDILDIVIDCFFPNGRNPVIGNRLDYVVQIVNNLNINVREIINPFTLSSYISSQKIPGIPRCNLLCHSAKEEDDDSDIINNSIDGASNEESACHVLSHLESNISKDNISPSDFSNDSAVELQQFYDSIYEVTSTEGNSGIEDGTAAQFFEQINPSYMYCNDSLVELKPDLDPITDAVKLCIHKTQNTDDPIDILRTYQQVFLKGRQLEQESDTEPLLDGNTLSIFASRQDLFSTGFSELIDTPLTDLQNPLEVTFYGEEASDSGGPRKEFFTIMMREFVKEENKLFVESSNGYKLSSNRSALEKKFYVGAALVCGLSLIENGPLPSFIEEEELTNILNGEDLTEAQQQFRQGFENLGLIDLIKAKPTFRFLFRQSSAPLTVRKLVSILGAQFSSEGSNKRRSEENIYKFFLKYLKEVAAGRRGKLLLEDILKFVTGSTQEPVLGFTMKPQLVFVPEGSSLPTSSTCSNLLKIPISSMAENQLFDLYDLAFSNDYFGIV